MKNVITPSVVWTHSLELVSLGESMMVVHGWSCLSRTMGASLLLCNVVNRANVRCTGDVCQYVVFILKLILSYLSVHRTYSLPSSPLSLVANIEELSEKSECVWVCPGGWLPDARYRQHAFILSDGGKMFYMSVGVIGAWANVRCTGRYDNIRRNHTFPEYLNSTLSHPRRIYRHVNIPRKRKLPPNGPSYYHR